LVSLGDGEYWSNTSSPWKPIGYKYKAWHVEFKTGFLAPTLNYTEYLALSKAVRNSK